jgi:hypothetical protein
VFNPTNGGVPPLKTQRGMSAWQDFMRRSFCEQPWQIAGAGPPTMGEN